MLSQWNIYITCSCTYNNNHKKCRYWATAPVMNCYELCISLNYTTWLHKSWAYHVSWHTMVRGSGAIGQRQLVWIARSCLYHTVLCDMNRIHHIVIEHIECIIWLYNICVVVLYITRWWKWLVFVVCHMALWHNHTNHEYTTYYDTQNYNHKEYCHRTTATGMNCYSLFQYDYIYIYYIYVYICIYMIFDIMTNEKSYMHHVLILI